MRWDHCQIHMDPSTTHDQTLIVFASQAALLSGDVGVVISSARRHDPWVLHDLGEAGDKSLELAVCCHRVLF